MSCIQIEGYKRIQLKRFTMSIIQSTKTAEGIAMKSSRLAEVFNEIGIDLSDGINKTLRKTDHEVGAAEEQLKETLQEDTLINLTTSQEFNTCDINSLIDYIINIHHSFVKANTIIIYDLAQQVSYEHSENPEFTQLAAKSFLFFHDLLNNIMIEEEVLFPNIKQLIKNRRLQGKAVYTTFGLISESVKLMEKKHAAAEKDLKFLRSLTNNYQLSEDSNNSCDYLFKKMQEFEKDWFVHVHLETNILFPKAIALDEALE
jgi:regulator of cell morphogenesis and NO signaling